MVSSSKYKYWIICTLLGISFFFVGTLIPLLRFPLMFVYSVPVLIVTVEIGILPGIVCALAGTTVLIFAFGPGAALIFLLSFSLQGVLFGLAAKRIKTGADLVLSGLLIALMCKVSTVLIFAQLTGVNFLSPGTEEIEKAVLAFWQSRLSSLPSGEAQKFTQQLKEAAHYFTLLMPFVLILFSSVEVLVNYFISSYIHKKTTGDPFFSLPEFGTWHFPKNILLALVVGFFCELIGEKRADAVLLRQIGANLGMITRTLFIVQGLAVAYNLMQQRGFPRVSRIIVLVVTPLVSFLSDIFSIVGIIDIGFDLRKKLGRDNK